MDDIITPGIVDKLIAMPETLVCLVAVYLMYKITMEIIKKDKDKGKNIDP